MEVPRQPAPVLYVSRNETVQEALQRAADVAAQTFAAPAELLIVILERKETAIYKEVKRACDGAGGVGVVSQCLVAGKAGIGDRSFNKAVDQYCANIALKVNAKLGGAFARARPLRAAGNKREERCAAGRRPRRPASSPSTPPAAAPPAGANTRLVRTPTDIFGACVPRRTMLIGMDLTHPPPGAPTGAGAVSVAAIVASMDENFGHYATRVLSQARAPLLFCFAQPQPLRRRRRAAARAALF
jgi:hypothetical protein